MKHQILLGLLLLFGPLQLLQAQTYADIEEVQQPIGQSSEVKAIETIIASAPIRANIDVSFTAGKSIELNPGFEAVPGTRFVATIAPVINQGDIQTDELSLQLQVYPNPFQTKTTIRYFLPTTTNVQLHLATISGQVLQELVHADQQKAGEYWVEYNGTQLAQGPYLYVLATKIGRRTFKAIKE